ncbi:hypothetical protein GCM10010377_47980 [Streptomyces viridiviolaceus]|nr:hypothetical protein GCM10010377_47980 [Streptomyces viridiviolaceus]
MPELVLSFLMNIEHDITRTLLNVVTSAVVTREQSQVALFTGFTAVCAVLREAPGPRRVRCSREATALVRADENVAAPGGPYELLDAPAMLDGRDRWGRRRTSSRRSGPR